MSSFQYNLDQLVKIQQTSVGPYTSFPTAPSNDRDSATSGYQSEISTPIMANWNGIWSINGAITNWGSEMLDKTLTGDSSVQTVIHNDVGKDLDEGVNGWVDNRQRYEEQRSCPVAKSSSSNPCYSANFIYPWEFEQFKQMLEPELKIPPEGYICHICYQYGHYIIHCPKADIQSQYTPYQGTKKCYGEFVCPKCKHFWQTANSYANQEQECINCKIGVFSRKQMTIERAFSMGLLAATADGSFIVVKKIKSTSCSTANTTQL